MLRQTWGYLSQSPQLPNDTLQEPTHLEQARADFYALLSALLLHPPSSDFLSELARADPVLGARGTLLCDSWSKLVLAAARANEDSVREEYERLFVSISDPLVNPHASFYLAGFLMDLPLAQLRTDLGQLGLARRSGARELEDHLGVLFETMRILIEQGQPLALQQQFFERHIHSWAVRATQDIRRAGGGFYSLVADFIDAFLDFEAEGFAMGISGAQQ